MKVEDIIREEKESKRYAQEFFEDEWEMGGIFESDTKILDSILPKGRLFDATMGPGRHVKHFLAKGFEVWGNDYNKHMLTQARKYIGKKKVKLLNKDIRDLSGVPDNFFDSVISVGASFGSIHKQADRQQAMRELARVAKKGGLVVIHAHNVFEISHPADILGLLKMSWNALTSPSLRFGDVVYEHSDSLKVAYMHWFSPSEMRGLMKRVGLRVEKEFYLQGPDQDRLVRTQLPFIRDMRAGGFIFVGRKR